MALADGTQPQPNIALVREHWRGHPARHPGPQDIFLLVEVADASLPFDTAGKHELYARSGIPEYWIVDLNRDVVRIHCKPSAHAYGTGSELAALSRLVVEALPQVSVTAAPLFN